MMTAETTCPPLADRVTKSLLGYGVIAGPIYVLAVAAQAATRVGFDPTRHTASQLANGDLGWIQIATFLVTGAATIAAAVGIRRALGRASAWAAGLIGVYGAGLVAAGCFRADPSDGFPPGTPPGMGEPTWHGLAHLAVASVGFLGLMAACFVFAARFSRGGERGWAWFSLVTGIVFAGTFAFMASGAGVAAILSFTAAVVLSWAWLTAVSVKLYKAVAA